MAKENKSLKPNGETEETAQGEKPDENVAGGDEPQGPHGELPPEEQPTPESVEAEADTAPLQRPSTLRRVQTTPAAEGDAAEADSDNNEADDNLLELPEETPSKKGKRKLRAKGEGKKKRPKSFMVLLTVLIVLAAAAVVLLIMLLLSVQRARTDEDEGDTPPTGEQVTPGTSGENISNNPDPSGAGNKGDSDPAKNPNENPNENPDPSIKPPDGTTDTPPDGDTPDADTPGTVTPGNTDPPSGNSGTPEKDHPINEGSVLTSADTVNYLLNQTPATLGLEGNTMEEYEVYPTERVVLVDGILCTELMVYGDTSVAGTNVIQGVYLVSRDGSNKIYKLDKSSDTVTELKPNAD